MDKVVVSICVLTYNQEDTIARTLDSLLCQKFDPGFEIIIGDDCSTDKTVEICRKYEGLNPGVITLLVSEKNNGVLENFRRVSSRIKGDFFGLCAGDDYWHDPDKLKKQFEYLTKHEDCGIVYSSYRTINRKNNELEFFRLGNPKSGMIFNDLFMGNFIPAVTVLIRTEAFKRCVNVDEYINSQFMMEDFPMWLDISFHYNFGYIDEPLATYEISGDSISNPIDVSKNLRFAKNVLHVKTHFAEKYSLPRRLLSKSVFVSNIQILCLTRRYRRVSDIWAILSGVEMQSIFRYLFLSVWSVSK